MGRRPGLARIPSDMLAAELRRRERGVKKLYRKRATLLARLEEIDDVIRQHGGEPGGFGGGRGRRGGGGGGGRPRNEMSLEDALAKALNGKTMSVTEAAEAVQRAGYRTGAANFRTIVNAALLRSDKIKKVARGQYTAK
jgi:hypothetical protein